MNRVRATVWLAVVYTVFAGLLWTGAARGELSVVFAAVEEGQRVLTTRDAFVERLSPFDRAARMKTDRAVSEPEFLAFAAQAVRAWDSTEQSQVEAALRQVQPALARLYPNFAAPVYFVKTTGAEEGNMPYTRGNAIIVPQSELRQSDRQMRRLLAHEFFHVISRNDPALRRALYRAIGFHECGEVALPPVLKARKITNPDAPANEHCIRVRAAGEPVWALPILFSKVERYDPARGGELFDYLAVALLLVDEPNDATPARPLLVNGNPRLLAMNQVTDLYEQIGRNTQYIIHPEEILADNFRILVLGESDVPSPEVLKRIAAVFEQAASRGARASNDALKMPR